LIFNILDWLFEGNGDDIGGGDEVEPENNDAEEYNEYEDQFVERDEPRDIPEIKEKIEDLPVLIIEEKVEQKDEVVIPNVEKKDDESIEKKEEKPVEIKVEENKEETNTNTNEGEVINNNNNNNGEVEGIVDQQQQIDPEKFAAEFAKIFLKIQTEEKDKATITTSADESFGEKKEETNEDKKEPNTTSEASVNKLENESEKEKSIIENQEEDEKKKVNPDTLLPLSEHKRYHDIVTKSSEFFLSNGCRFVSEGKQLNVDNKTNVLERYYYLYVYVI
jgi:hypothetical protein